MRLYHYTCHHARDQIVVSMILKPNKRSYGKLLWLTDLDRPAVHALGLTSYMLNCDRIAYKITVDTDLARPWTVWAHENKVPSLVRLALDGSDGAQPRNWWISTEPVPVLSVEPTWSKNDTVQVR